VNGQRRRAGSSAGLVHFATKLPGAIGGVVALLSAIGWRLGGPPDAPGPREPCVLFAAAPRLEHASRTDVFSSLLKLLNGLLLLAGGSAQTGAELFLARRRRRRARLPGALTMDEHEPAPFTPPGAAPQTPPGAALAGAGPGGLRGRFLVVQSATSSDLDEYFLAACVGVGPDWVAWTTADEPPHAFEFRLLALHGAGLAHGGFRLVDGTGADRTAPLGIQQTINVICDPHTFQPWAPSDADTASIIAEGTTLATSIAALRAQQPLNPDAGNFLPRVALRAAYAPAAPARAVPGIGAAAGAAAAARLAGLARAAGEMPPPLPPPPEAPLPFATVPGAPVPGKGSGLGFPGPDAADAGAGTPRSQQLQSELHLLRNQFDSMVMKAEETKKRKKSRDRKVTKVRKDDKKKDRKKSKKKKKHSDSESSRSSPDSSSSSGDMPEANEKYLQWTPADMKRSKFEQSALLRFHTLRFRKRSDLLNFSMKYPGGLAAHFLGQVRMKLGQPLPVDSLELTSIDATHWAATMSELKDVRDVKEVMFLSKILSELSHDRLPQVADLLAMRIREIRMAKRDSGSSWDKAGVISLLPGPFAANAPVPDGAFHL